MAADFVKLAEELRATALGYPETVEESPWGDRVVKVRKKVFVFLGTPNAESVGMGVKLPISKDQALKYAGVEPMGYGLGKSGWVSIQFRRGQEVPQALLFDWLDESFRAVAPRTVSKRFPGRPQPKREKAAPTVAGEPSVLLVGDDPLRLERAVEALAEVGVAARVASLADAVDAADAPVERILVDLSRRAQQAIETAAAIGLARWDVPLGIAGVRDAEMEQQVRRELPKAAFVTREPPGDPEVVNLLRSDQK